METDQKSTELVEALALHQRPTAHALLAARREWGDGLSPIVERIHTALFGYQTEAVGWCIAAEQGRVHNENNESRLFSSAIRCT